MTKKGWKVFWNNTLASRSKYKNTNLFIDSPWLKLVYTMVMTMEVSMKTAVLFKNGRSQAVRLPKECRFAGREVYIRKFEDIVILSQKRSPWTPLLNSLDKFSDDFMSERVQPDQKAREKF